LTDFEQELEDTDVKTILLGIHAELAKLRMVVEQSESETRYECHDCSETFSDESALIGHAIEVHKAPPGMEFETYGRAKTKTP